MDVSAKNKSVDQTDLLLEEYLRGEKLPAFGSVALISGGLLVVGMLINIGAAIIGLDAIEVVSLGLCTIVCPISIVIPFLVIMIVQNNTRRVAQIATIAPSPQANPSSDGQIVRVLLKGAYIQVGSVILLVAVFAALMAFNLSLQPSFWDRLAGSYGTYDPDHVYTSTEQATNALFCWVILCGVVCINLISVTAGLWLGLWRSSMLVRLIIFPLMMGVLVVLMFSLGIGAEISPNYSEQLPDAGLIPALFCVLPAIGISYLFYLGAYHTIHRQRKISNHAVA